MGTKANSKLKSSRSNQRQVQKLNSWVAKDLSREEMHSRSSEEKVKAEIEGKEIVKVIASTE